MRAVLSAKHLVLVVFLPLLSGAAPEPSAPLQPHGLEALRAGGAQRSQKVPVMARRRSSFQRSQELPAQKSEPESEVVVEMMH